LQKLTTMITPKKPTTRKEVEFDKYSKLAREIFEKKNKDNWYEVFGEDCHCEDYIETSIRVRLSDEEVRFLKDLLNNPEEEFTLEELQEEIPFYDRLTLEEPFFFFVPKSIDFEHPIHYYAFTAIVMKSEDDAPKKKRCKLPLSDEEYIQLISWRLQNREESFNNLYERHPDISYFLNRRFISILGHLELGIDLYDPFLVFMDELDKDVFDAVGEPEFGEEVFSYSNDDKIGHTVLNIKEKVLEFTLEDIENMYTLHGKRKYLMEIDAIAVQKAMGATCYSDLYDKIKTRFGNGMEDFDNFKLFLDECGITYRYNETD